jgi:hypothetical protein
MLSYLYKNIELVRYYLKQNAGDNDNCYLYGCHVETIVT